MTTMIKRTVNRLVKMSQYKNAAKLLDPATTKAKIDSVTALGNDQSKFIKLNKINYTSPLGKKGVWEMAERSTKPSGSEVDAVIIVPVLKYTDSKDDELVFVRQFRPPVNGVMVEFPAGLVDPNDTVESCAIRELKEETGYVSENITKKSGILFSDPGLSNASCCIVWIDVDMSLPENQNPVPHWMDDEVIEVVPVKINDLASTMEQWNQKGYLLDSKIQTLLFGLSLRS